MASVKSISPPSDYASVKVALKRVDLEAWISQDVDLLGGEFFRSLERAARKSLLEPSSARRFNDGAMVFEQKDNSQALYLIIRGQVRLTAASGHEAVEVGLVSKGGVFGEHEAVDECDSRCYSALAVGELDVVEMPRWIVQQVLAAQPSLLAHLKQVDQQRRAHLTEMASFLGRW